MKRVVQVHPQGLPFDPRRQLKASEFWKGQQHEYKAVFTATNQRVTWERLITASDDDTAIQVAKDLTPERKKRDDTWFVLTAVYRLDDEIKETP